MSDRKTLEDLLARVEQAPGPDRELDGTLWCLSVGYAERVSHNPSTVFYTKSSGENANMSRESIPEYSASIDAALALVERLLPLHDIELHCFHHANGTSFYAEIGDQPQVEGATLPLAILAALLRALTTQTEHEASNVD